MFICKHCKNEFNNYTCSQKANHTRWCLENPKRSTYGKNVSQLNTKEAIEKRSKKIKQAHLEGKYTEAYSKTIETKKNAGKFTHTEETKKLLSEKALASKHRRLIRSIREYIKTDGSIVMLDSSWEEALAKRLDELNIKWIRPENPISYVALDGKTRNYFPDFYLADYNLYLDPKNPAAMNAQKDKIDILLNMMDNLVIIETLDGCKNFQV